MNKKTNNKTKRVKSYSNSSWIVFASIALSILIIAILCANVLSVHRQELKDKLKISAESELNRYYTEMESLGVYGSMVRTSGDFLLDYTAFYLKEFGYTKDVIDELSERLPVNIYFAETRYKSADNMKLNIVSSAMSNSYLLDYDETVTLCLDGKFETVNSEGRKYQYLSKHVDNGFLIISYSAVGFDEMGINLNHTSTAYNDVELILIDDSTNTIVSGNREEYIGEDKSSIVLAENNSDNNVSDINLKGIGWCLGLNTVTENYTLIAYIPYSAFILEVIRNSMIPVILVAAIILVMLVYILRIRKQAIEIPTTEKSFPKHVFGNIYVDGEILSHITALAVFSIFLCSLALFYIQALISYSDQNQTASANLKRIEEAYNNNINNQNVVMSDIESEYVGYAQEISWIFMRNPEAIDDSTLLSLRTASDLIKDIVVVDGNGTVVASTNNEDGYTIGKGEGASNYQIWEVLDNQIDSLFYINEATVEPNDYMVVVRRQDSKGIVMVNMIIDGVDQFIEKMNLEKTMLAADFGEANIIAITKDAEPVAYIAEPGATQVYMADKVLDAYVLVNGYTGIGNIKGISHYFNVLDDAAQDLFFVSAIPLRKISFMSAIKSWIIIVLGIVAFALVLIWGTARIEIKPDELEILTKAFDEEKIETRRLTSDSIRNNLINSEFRSVIHKLVIFAGALEVALLFFDYELSENSLVEFLLGSDWKRGLNLFSITMILLISVSGVVASFLLRKLIMLVATNMGQRGLTIGHLLSSLVRFILLLTCILLSLMELGCNLSALLAGAGIAGAAISLCANSTINDLLSGFFIVFEGAFQIGDWIKVGDWRGEVIEIGIRTTKVAKANCVMIINNSQMTNVTVMDWTNSGAVADIEIAYKENVDKVVALLNESQERFKAEIPSIEDGPYVLGVTDLGSNGVTIRVFAFGEDQSSAASIERDIRRVAKKIFDENGIEIPFNQVTIHQGD